MKRTVSNRPSGSSTFYGPARQAIPWWLRARRRSDIRFFAGRTSSRRKPGTTPWLSVYVAQRSFGLPWGRTGRGRRDGYPIFGVSGLFGRGSWFASFWRVD